MNCKYCHSEHVHKNGNHNGKQRYKCINCGKYFTTEEIANKQEYITYFNTKLKKSDYNKLTRDNYCKKNYEIDNDLKRLIKKCRNRLQECENFIKEHGEIKECVETIKLINLLYGKYINIPNEVLEDENHYSKEYYDKAYEDRMTNYDLNMQYFHDLEQNKFNTYIEQFVNKYHFKEIKDLNELDNVYGIYMLVLDEYKQVYIGISSNIKSRILSHWNGHKVFSKMIYGSVETSILSIDSFGALDTTRIFYKGNYIDERKIVKEFKKEYRLNRVEGGINDVEDTELRNLMLRASIQKRELKQNNNQKFS